MKRYNQIIWSLFTCFFMLIPFNAKGLTIEKMLTSAQTDGSYVQPETKEYQLAYQLFIGIFKGNFSKKMQEEWRQLGFILCTTCQSKYDFAVLREKKSQKKGRGFYLFSTTRSPARVLEMPHSLKDLDTGAIGLKLALENKFTAIAFNTVPRSYTDSAKRRKVSADLSDLYGTIFEAFTKAFATIYENGRIFQIHGFVKEKRKTEAAKTSHIIISNGTKQPDVKFPNLDKCLEEKLMLTSGIYPTEVIELGATQTSIGIALRDMGHNGFVHIEMNRDFRRRLLNEESTRKQFFECINGAFQ